MAEYEEFGPDKKEVIRDVLTILAKDHGRNEIHFIWDIIHTSTNFGSYRGYWSSNIPYELAAQECEAQSNYALKMFLFVDRHILRKRLQQHARDVILASMYDCKHI